MINVAIDISPLSTASKFRGVGMYIKRLVEALQHQENLKILTFEGKKVPTEADLVHYPYFSPFSLTLPFFLNKKFVVTIHDLIPLVFPRAYPLGIKGSLKFTIQKKLLKKAKMIITDSQSSSDDIAKFTSYPKEKITVIYLAADSELKRISDEKFLDTIRKKFNLPEKFVLYVGDVNYNKNLPSLVKACRLVKTPLVIVGKQALSTDFDPSHIENRSLVELNDLIKQQNDVIRTGFITDEEKAGLYSLASVYCQPSLYEGFGLPVLEAMAYGCPVVASRTSSLPEIGGKAAFYIDPYSIDAISRGVETVLKDDALRVKLIKAGLIQAKKFSWEKTARETMKTYEKVLGK